MEPSTQVGLEQARRPRSTTNIAKWGLSTLLLTLVAVLVAGFTLAFGWWDLAIMCLLGIIVGGVASYVLREAPEHKREAYYVALAFGMLLVPALAVYLSGLAARDGSAFASWNTSFTPFITYALATLVTSVALGAIWRKTKEQPVEPAEEEPGLDEWRMLEAEAARGEEEEAGVPSTVGGREVI